MVQTVSKCSKPMHCNATKSGKLSQILILKFFKYFNTSNSSNTLRLQTLIFNGKRVSDEKDGFSSTESTSNIIKKEFNFAVKPFYSIDKWFAKECEDWSCMELFCVFFQHLTTSSLTQKVRFFFKSLYFIYKNDSWNSVAFAYYDEKYETCRFLWWCYNKN